MADPVLVQTASNSAVAATSLTVTLASAPVAGELIMCVVRHTDNYPTVSSPAGFTQDAEDAGGGVVRVFTKIATGGEGTDFTFASPTANGFSARVMRWTGIGAFNAVNTTGSGGVGTHSINGAGTTVADAVVFSIVGMTSTTLPTTQTSWNNSFVQVAADVLPATGSGQRAGLAIASKVVAVTGNWPFTATYTPLATTTTEAISVAYALESAGPLTVDVGADQGLFTGQSANIEATASGGGGTRTYAWSKVSGPSGTFGDAANPTTTFTPAASGTFNLRCTVTDDTGSAQDDMQVLVTDPTASSTVTSVTVDTNWTVEPGTDTAAGVLSDTDAGTYVTSQANPVDQILTFVLGPITAPGVGVDLVMTLTADSLDAASASLDARLYEGGTGGTLISTVLDRPITAGVVGQDVTNTVVVTFPAADIASVVDWNTGLTVQLQVTAAV